MLNIQFCENLGGCFLSAWNNSNIVNIQQQELLQYWRRQEIHGYRDKLLFKIYWTTEDTKKLRYIYLDWAPYQCNHQGVCVCWEAEILMYDFYPVWIRHPSIMKPLLCRNNNLTFVYYYFSKYFGYVSMYSYPI